MLSSSPCGAKSRPWILYAAAVFGALAIITGAFGAHGLKHRLSEADLAVWHTAVEYQMYHSIALLVLAVSGITQKKIMLGAGCWVLGIGLFCGSLYALALGAPRVLGILTPVGGLFFIIGWLCLVWVARSQTTD